MILRIKNVMPVFKNMNKVLVDSYKRRGIIPSLGEHRKNFEHTYNVRIVVDNSIWSAFEFPSEHDATLAIIKYG